MKRTLMILSAFVLIWRRILESYSFFDPAKFRISDFYFDQVDEQLRKILKVFVVLKEALEVEKSSVKVLLSNLGLCKGSSGDKYVSFYRVHVELMPHKKLAKNNRKKKTSLVCKINFYLVTLVTPILKILKTLSLGFLRTSSLIKSPSEQSY